MKRRQFITLLGGAGAWPFTARAQAVPVVGWLSGSTPEGYGHFAVAFRRGLSEAGYVEGKNVTIEYRWARDQYDDLPAMAKDLVSRQVSLIVTTGGFSPPIAAKAATSTIPIVFVLGGDPVHRGLVASLNRPEGNITGLTLFSAQLLPKKLEFMSDLVPNLKSIAFLINPTNPTRDSQVQELLESVRSVDIRLHVLSAGTEQELGGAFEMLVRRGAGAVMTMADPFLLSQRARLAELAIRNAVPMIGASREQVIAGALISYGASYPDILRQAGLYAGRILRGSKPADLPVVQPTRFELVINLKTAKALGLTVPDALLARADEVIE